jgi:DNA replication protein DnaC
MRKLPVTAAEELLEIVMRRYERTSTLPTSNRPVDDWGKLLGDSAAVTATLDRLLHFSNFRELDFQHPLRRFSVAD